MTKRKPYSPSFGSISTGTMLASDLIPDFTYELKQCIGRRHGFATYRTLIREADKIEDYDSEDANYILEDLFDALDEFAPAYGYFGAHPGDGADYGFWLHEDWQQNFRDDGGLEVSDTGEIPADYQGEVLQISDHGNATLYVKTARKLIEVWSIV